MLAPSFKTSDYVGMLGRSRRKVPTLRPAISDGRRADCARLSRVYARTWQSCRDRRRISTRVRRTASAAAARGRDQHPVHERHDRACRKARRCPITTSSTTATSSRVGMTFTRERQAVHSGAAVSLLRHGDGRARLRDARRGDGFPGEAFEPKSVLEAVDAERCTALYGVPTMFIAELEHPEFARYDLRRCAPA